MSSNSDVRLLSRRALAIEFAAAFTACHKSEPRLNAMKRVFAGFTFVGEFPAQDVGLESRSHNATALPSSWRRGPQYVFHLDTDCDFEEVPTRLLPDRLRPEGATIIYAPKSSGEMAIPNTGNPFWKIEFALGAYRGQIVNRFDVNRRRQFWNSAKLRRNLPDARTDDYVLTFAALT